ncbi:leucine-rich protein [Oceanobacter sp. RED65]|uniref:Leucine-rich protein n=2 Tax=Bermanella marisrubri TaxID=207949 RepID=Q1N4Z7_9GAMM|nr:leucine-rich protein [Oceanobacter sp. RED65] [Bermanella marisrubri]
MILMRILFLHLLVLFSVPSWSLDFIIGKDQAPINQHDYEVLKKVAENAQLPVEEFRHYLDRDQYIVDDNGLIYWDKEENGIIDGDDSFQDAGLAHLGNSYITDDKGNVVALDVIKSSFSQTELLNGFKHLIAVHLFKNKVSDIRLSNLPELRSLNVYHGDGTVTTVSELSNLKKLAYLNVFDLSVADFEKASGLESLYKVELTSADIGSFKGLENMPNLKEMSISVGGGFNGHNLKTLDSLPKDHGLEKLKLSSGYTTDISGIAHLSKLKRFEFWNNNKKLKDLSPLNKLKNLEELEVTAFAVKDFAFLKDMPKLKSITTYHAPITSLEGLHEAPNLEELKLYSGKLEEIAGLQGNPELKTLYFNNHNIKKLAGLNKLKKLNTLDVSRNHIEKIEGLEHNQCLEKLWLNSNPVKKLENLDHLPILRELGLDRTNITKLDGWQNLDRLGKIIIDPSQLEYKRSNDRYFYRYIPIKEIDMKLKQSEPITEEEYKKYDCL